VLLRIAIWVVSHVVLRLTAHSLGPYWRLCSAANLRVPRLRSLKRLRRTYADGYDARDLEIVVAYLDLAALYLGLRLTRAPDASRFCGGSLTWPTRLRLIYPEIASPTKMPPPPCRPPVGYDSLMAPVWKTGYGHPQLNLLLKANSLIVVARCCCLASGVWEERRIAAHFEQITIPRALAAQCRRRRSLFVFRLSAERLVFRLLQDGKTFWIRKSWVRV